MKSYTVGAEVELNNAAECTAIEGYYKLLVTARNLLSDLFPLIVAAMKELGKDNVTDEQVAIIKQAIEKYGSPDEIKYDYSIAPQWIKQRLAL